MGRPKLKPTDRRSVLLGARFTPEEARRVREKAKDAGLDASDLIRQRLLEN